MAKYQIITPHDPAQCVQALDDMLAHDPTFIDHVWFGCHVGDHTGYAVLEDESEESARKRLPPTLARRARVVQVEHATPEDIKANHEEAA